MTYPNLTGDLKCWIVLFHTENGSAVIYVDENFIAEMREILGGGPRDSELKKLVEENRLRDEFEKWIELVKDEMDFDLMITWG